MSGHSKWSQIKRQKGVADAKRGQIFTKLTREIMIAVRQGGSDPEGNFRLRLAIQRARDSNMPTDNIQRAIKRAAGTADASALSEVTYEGYGPGGMAILVQVLTDNRNRTLNEVRNAFSRHNGNMGEAGSVSWLFDQQGVIAIDASTVNAEELALLAIDAGAEDVKVEDSLVEVHTRPQELEKVRKSLEEKDINIASAELSMVPKTVVPLDEKSAIAGLKLLERLEELDDVQHVYSNADFPDKVLEGYRAS